MARAEDTILRRYLAIVAERGRLRGQIIRNLDVEGEDFDAAQKGIWSALRQINEIEKERVLLQTILDVTKADTEWEERQKNDQVAE